MKALGPRGSGYLALFGAGSLWGLGFVFGKIALAHMPVAPMIAYRFLVGSVAIAPVLFRRRISIRRSDLWVFAAAALLYVPIQSWIQFEGLARTSVTHASLMCALAPALVAIASIALRGRGRPNWMAIAASMAGAALVVAGQGNGSTLVGDVLVALSLIAAVGWIMVAELGLGSYDPVAVSGVVLIAGTAVLFAFEALAHPHELFALYPQSAWLATAGAGVLSTAAAATLWMIGLSRVPATDAGIFINLEPLIGSACGVAFFGDPLRWSLVAGALLVIGSALAITRSKGAAPADQGRRPVERRPRAAVAISTAAH